MYAKNFVYFVNTLVDHKASKRWILINMHIQMLILFNIKYDFCKINMYTIHAHVSDNAHTCDAVAAVLNSRTGCVNARPFLRTCRPSTQTRRPRTKAFCCTNLFEFAAFDYVNWPDNGREQTMHGERYFHSEIHALVKRFYCKGSILFDIFVVGPLTKLMNKLMLA